MRRGLMSEQDFQASESGARARLPSKRDWRASPSPNGAQLAFPGIPFVAFADMRAVWCITHRAAAPSNARSAPKTTGSRRTAICRGHCLCCRDTGQLQGAQMGPSWRFQASHLLLSRTCALCGASRIVRQHPVTRAQHPRPQAAAVRPSAEAIVCVAGAAARSSNGAQLAFLHLEVSGLTCGMPNPWPGNIFRNRQKQ